MLDYSETGPASLGDRGVVPGECLVREDCDVKTTRYFESLRTRADRAGITDEWIEFVIHSPEKEQIQKDGRIRRWARIAEADGRALRVVLLEDGLTVHNAFFDRGYKP